MPAAVSKRPLVLIIRDGWGRNPFPQWNHANAVHLAPILCRSIRRPPKAGSWTAPRPHSTTVLSKLPDYMNAQRPVLAGWIVQRPDEPRGWNLIVGVDPGDDDLAEGVSRIQKLLS